MWCEHVSLVSVDMHVISGTLQLHRREMSAMMCESHFKCVMHAHACKYGFTKSNQKIKSFILSLNSQFTIMICTCQHKIKNKLPGKGFQKSIAYLAGLPSWTKYYYNVV